MSTTRWDGTLTALSSIAHGGETRAQGGGLKQAATIEHGLLPTK